MTRSLDTIFFVLFILVTCAVSFFLAYRTYGYMKIKSPKWALFTSILAFSIVQFALVATTVLIITSRTEFSR